MSSGNSVTADAPEPGPTSTRLGERPPHRIGLLSAVLIAIVLLIVLPTWVFGYLPGVSGPPIVRVTKYCGGSFSSLQFDYAGPYHGYLSAGLDAPQFCTTPQGVPVRSTYSVNLSLQNTDTNRSHTLDSIGVANPFQLAGTSPSLSTSIGPGALANVDLTIRVPAFPGTYAMPSAVVYTT